MRKPLVGFMTVAVALLVAAVALASTQTITDKKGDSKSDVDLKSATVDYNGTILSFTVVSYPGKNPTGGCIQLKNNWFIGCFKQGSHYQAVNPTKQRQFNVKFSHPAKNTNLISFPASKLGHLASISWRAAFLEADRPADAIPNKGYSKFALTP